MLRKLERVKHIYTSINATLYCPYLLDDPATIHLKAKCKNMAKKFVCQFSSLGYKSMLKKLQYTIYHYQLFFMKKNIKLRDE